jgi:hypothetical protein
MLQVFGIFMVILCMAAVTLEIFTSLRRKTRENGKI